ncbi:dynein heavy chain cytosolic [Ceraceosorus bombacis]|uniref:Dynein heavy chain, cytoplasmic n=1 Tax=Ceraceosorus bombacis TaxID=401625 RepID=A0A0N7L9S4_9BASI|nr:dynein heavy chain cytosolic [Ceraceosorus bombacis]
MAAADGGLPPSASIMSLNSNANGAAGSRAGISRFPIALIRAYLELLLPVVMAATPAALEESLFSSSLGDVDEDAKGDGWHSVAFAFATDPSTMTVYIDKVRRDTSGSGTDGLFEYRLDTHPTYSPRHVSSIALIKRAGALDPALPLQQQVHVLSLFGPASEADRHASGEGIAAAPELGREDGRGGEEEGITINIRESPYEALHSVVHHVMAPWFDAYVSSKEDDSKTSAAKTAKPKSKDADARIGVPMAKRKFAELELSLLHLQQNVEIPEVYLSCHPQVRATVERCQAAKSKATVEEVRPSSLLQDSTFLNQLQSDVNNWVKEVQLVTRLDRDVSSGTASQEINFWLSMERAQDHIEQQLRSEPITLTLDILKHAKRFHATVSFLADTGLKDCTEKVQAYNILMKEFPLDSLLSATDFDKCIDAVQAVFNHLNKKMRVSPYPVKRALPLVEAISRDVNDAVLKILGAQRVMYQDFSRFCDTMQGAGDVFATWDDVMREFVNIAREVTRKRSEKFMPIKINPAHAKLRERLNYLSAFRKTHEQLRVMVTSGRGIALAASGSQTGLNTSGIARTQASAHAFSGIQMADEITDAFDVVKVVDVLDVTDEGTAIWSAAESAYNERVARVENGLIARLRDLLGQAKNAREMLRVLSQFNTLFVRPKVRGAVQEYQQQLLNSVKSDIAGLHDKFKAQYRPSEANHMSQLRDIPEIAGAIIWARQIERQLMVYMKRVEDVLGKGWELYAEGQKLRSESETFSRKLDTRPLFDGWLHDINRRDMTISGRLFEVSRNRATGQYSLGVNFDPQVIALFKEVRHLSWLGFQIPHLINNLARDAKRVYPYAVSLMETVRTYNQTCAQVREHPRIACLLARTQTDVHNLITSGTTLRWEHFANAYESHRAIAAYLPASSTAGDGLRDNKQVSYVRAFASAVSVFQDQTNALINMNGETSILVDELASCTYTRSAFAERLAKIQKTIDRLNLDGYPNLDDWVAELDARIEQVLMERLRLISIAWCEEFARSEETREGGSAGAAHRENGAPGGRHRRRDVKETRLSPAEKAALERDHVELSPVTHEIRIRNQIIYLDPPIEHARASWFTQLHDVLGVACGLRRVQSARYEMGVQMQKLARDVTTADVTYAGLLTRFEDTTLSRPFALIEAKVQEVGRYVAKWLRFQNLWDLEAEHVYATLGDSLARWQQLLAGIRKTRATFDTSDTQRSFGMAVIDYEQVQSKVNAKYDAWQRDVLNRFGTKLAAEMRETYAAIRKARYDLEQHSIESSSTAQTVTFITFVTDLKRQTKKWSPQMSIFATGQKTLERQRYMFSQDWLYADQVEGEWSAFNEILARKNSSIQEQLAGLQMKIIAEDKIVSDKIAVLVTEWEQQKPIEGTLKADTALNTISLFEGRVARLCDDRDLVIRAKEALDLEHTPDDRVEPVQEELRDLKAVWTALSGTWSQLSELRDSSWNNVQPRKLRQQLDGLLTQTKDMPSRMRQYAAFEYVQNILRDLLKSNALISELKSEAMRERHWRALFKQLQVSTPYSPTSMTLGIVWDLGLKRHEQAIKAVIMQAQGEMALEEFLKEVRERWTSYDLDLVNYQNRCRLVRGWDQLFQSAGDHLSALKSMANSPHHKVFEEEAALWESRLSQVSALFELLRDVQRRWVDCGGIFSGPEMRHILPVETSRFQVVDTEFLTITKRINKSPYVLDVINIPSINQSLDRLHDLLDKIQRALGAFLEKQRNVFPRFYFLGDEDLLSLLGSSKDVMRVGTYIAKMWQGVASVIFSDDSSLIGVRSPQDEYVELARSVPTAGIAVHEWLQGLETELRKSVAFASEAALANLAMFFTPSSFEAEKLVDWIERHIGQTTILVLGIQWTKLVEHSLQQGKDGLSAVLNLVESALDALADSVVQDLPALKRKKIENLLVELVHERDVLRELISHGTKTSDDWAWQSQMRYYSETSTGTGNAPSARIEMADASFSYGFNYTGVPDPMVITPLTTKAFGVFTQALKQSLAGRSEGPAGTGKTETVSLLGRRLGREVIVTCCGEEFDAKSISRGLLGCARVGSWAAFDEINRLSPNVLSSISEDILSWQSARRQGGGAMLSGQSVELTPGAAVFITLNPTYIGRATLPRSLTRLFRTVVMAQPDRQQIIQVLLYAVGFRSAELLARKLDPFFHLLESTLSKRSHYDLNSLRSIKATLAAAGQVKRAQGAHEASGQTVDVVEQSLAVSAVMGVIVPKLVGEDVALLGALLDDVFPGIQYQPPALDELRKHISDVCLERHLVCDGVWLDKIIQLYEIQRISHGVMLVGPSGTGKSVAWSVLLEALHRLEGIDGVSYVMDPKAVSKDGLYGTLDVTTREWTDGLFTNVLRRIVDNVRGESAKRHWIVFDGDVDPVWVENLNSVLDDNKLLTLPNGERIDLPSNVRVMFEVEHLRFATPATVSRCGMIWFSEESVTPAMLYNNYFGHLRARPLGAADDDDLAPSTARRDVASGSGDSPASTELVTQRIVADAIETFFAPQSLIDTALARAEDFFHIMPFTASRALTTLFSLINKTVRNVFDYNQQHPDFPLAPAQIEAYATKRLVVSVVWSFTGDAKLHVRAEMGEFLASQTGVDMPPLDNGASLIDFDVQVATAEWFEWTTRVPTIEIETHAVASADVVIPTMDTVRHEEVLYSWLSEHKPLMLCGPPGSGKTMTLFAALRKLPDQEVVGLNFSSATTPELILKTFDQHCEYRKTPNGVILAPKQIGRWIVLFCDEINLPATDQYGTQRVISFLRQLVERGGFWRTSDLAWVTLERIQFVGACNPPTDAGRVPLSQRFLRHAPLVMVDYPGEVSLNQIYGTFNRALLKLAPNLRGYAEALTSAMVDFYLASQSHFTPDMQAHYVYSPRELSRWVRGLYEYLKPVDDTINVEGLVRIWAHEGLRLFRDRLVGEDEKEWTDSQLDAVALARFPTVDQNLALARPIIYSNWLTRNTSSVALPDLRAHTVARLAQYSEEELETRLVLHDSVMALATSVDRVLRQRQGHLLLIGSSGSGRTTVTRFVAWLVGLSVFTISPSRRYGMADFDEDLRGILRRAGTQGEKLCFIIDESQVRDPAFLERMNTLLANAEIPGLFEGDEYSALMTACKEGSQRDGLMLDSPDELYSWFSSEISKNLHVVFTFNPEQGVGSRAATSPALFNRAVLIFL